MQEIIKYREQLEHLIDEGQEIKILTLINENNGEAVFLDDRPDGDIAVPITISMLDDICRSFIDRQLEGVNYPRRKAMTPADLCHEIAQLSQIFIFRRDLELFFYDMSEQKSPS